MRRSLLAARLSAAGLCLGLALARNPAAGQDAASIPALLAAHRFDDAAQAASRDADPVVAKLVEFARVLSPGAATLAQIESFTAQNPGWPQQAALAQRREAALAVDPDDATVAASCQRDMPQASAALARCAEAEQRLGTSDLALTAARAAWIAAPPDLARDDAFLGEWPDAIGPAENWARFARLAWTDPNAAGKLLPRLTGADRARAEAWLALRRDAPKAAALLAKVPDWAADPGLFLEQARWLRRADRDTEALALWQASGTEAERAAPEAHRTAFWDERNLLARRLLRQGDAAGAYALVAAAAQTAPEAVADADFLAGWIALRRLSDPARAAGHFAALSMLSEASVTQARAHYWLSRTAAATGDTAGARREALTAALYPTTFYGQLAALSAGDTVAALNRRITGRAEPVWTQDDAAAFVRREPVRAALYLASWNEPGHAAGFLLRLGDATDADVADLPVDLAMTARLATLFGLPQTGIALARRAGRSGIALIASGWPLDPAVPPDGPAEAALVLAVIRQESSFDPAAASPAGARGLMQLMPAQAQAAARALGLPVSTSALTEDPGLNVQLGSVTLRDLLGRFQSSLPLAAAAYNAGPTRVAQWLAQNGDPLHGDAATMIDWIELIPFSETRNYVQRVIESTAIYRARLGQTLPYPIPLQAAPA